MSISMNEIAERDGKAGVLFWDIAVASETIPSLAEIAELEERLDELKAEQPNYRYIPDMVEDLAHARENAEDAEYFEIIKAEVLDDTGDEELAEDVAEELAYC